jgi:cytochrome c biogenesis protein
MALLAVGVLASYRAPAGDPWLVLAPLAALAANLLAAMAVDPRFRSQGGLLVFHICLLIVMLLVGAQMLVSLDARVEIAEGQAFEPEAVQVRASGPLHPPGRIESVGFGQGPVAVEFGPGLVRGRTRSQVTLDDGRSMVFGDTKPLVIRGFRFYTTSNKGFAALLTWRGDHGPEHAGAIHFDPYPLRDWNQVKAWTTPAGEQVEIELVAERPVPERVAWVLDRSGAGSASALVLRTAAGSVELRRGQSISLDGGRLRFDDLRMWMGYRIVFDPTLPWLLAAGMVGVFGLGWHFQRKLWFRSAAGPKRVTREEAGDVRPVAGA